MFRKICIFISMCNVAYGSHANGWQDDSDYNVSRRESLPGSSLNHTASTSIISQRIDRGVIDLAGVPRVTSDDSPNSKNSVHVTANIAVKTDAKCCNSNCCDDDKVYDCCC